MYLSFKSRVKYHDWSVENTGTRNLIERLEIIKALGALPFHEVAECLAPLDVETKERIISLVTAICYKKQP